MDKLYEAAFQDSFLAHALSDTDFLKAVAPTLDPEYFTNELAQRLLRVTLNFYESEKSAPGRLVTQVLLDLKAQGLVSDKLIGQINVYADQLLSTPLGHKRYLLERYDKFVRFRRMTRMFQKALEAIKREDLDKADQLVMDYVQTRQENAAKPEREGGFFDPNPAARAARRILQQEDEYYFLISALDAYNVKLVPGDLCVFMSQFSGIGKSWALMHCVLSGIVQAKKVLYIVIGEMRRPQVEDRFDVMISGLARPSLDEGDKLYKRLNHIFRLGDPPWIECFPSGGPTVQDLRKLESELANAHNFEPEIIVIDYMDNIRALNQQAGLYEQGVEISTSLKAWADSGKIVITAAQGNREAQNVVTSGQGQAGGSRAKYEQATLFITMNRTPEEAKANLIRLMIDKARNLKDKLQVTIKTDFERGQFALNEVTEDDMVQAAAQEQAKPRKRRVAK